MNTIFTFQDASTWDAQNDTGFITFATPEDAKKAAELFTRVQDEAWNTALEEAAKETTNFRVKDAILNLRRTKPQKWSET